MNEWALLQGGEVKTIITTSKDQATMTADYPSYEARPLGEVPLAVLERYRYWGERP